MNFTKYTQDALATATYPGRYNIVGVSYCALKMAGEAGELLEHVTKENDDALIIKEIGDILWYVAATMDELGITHHQATCTHAYGHNMPEVATSVSLAVSRYTECLGKAMRDDSYGTTTYVLSKERAALISDLLDNIVYALEDASYLCGLTLQDVADINIAKLRDRNNRGVVKGDGDTR